MSKIIHHWKMSETLAQYASGDIIILAEDVEAARTVARVEFEKYLHDEDGPMGVYWAKDGSFLSDLDEERYHELLARLDQDLAQEPSTDAEAIFILGSS